MDIKLTPKDVLLDLLNIIPQVELEIGDDERYIVLINYLKTNNFKKERDLPRLSIKQIAQNIGMSVKQINSQLVEIHKRLFNNDTSVGFKFNKVRVCFFVSLEEEGPLFFMCDSLKFLPKVGDNLFLPFLH